MRIWLIVLFDMVSVLAKVVGSIVLACGVGGSDLKLFVVGIDILVLGFVVDEVMKYFCRKTTARFDAYVAALGEPPLPGRPWHWLRSFARGYRLQEVR